MSSVNKTIIIGNLTRDPEIRHAQSGDKIANLSVATSERWKGKTGDWQERSEYHRVVVFNERIAEVCEKFLRKGSKVFLEGSLQTRKWTGNDGVEKYTTEIVLQKFRGELIMLDAPKRDDPSGQRYAPQEPPRGPQPVPSDLNDTIPF